MRHLMLITIFEPYGPGLIGARANVLSPGNMGYLPLVPKVCPSPPEEPARCKFFGEAPICERSQLYGVSP